MLLATLFLVVELSLGYDFDKIHTGVFFTPYIKHPNNEDYIDPYSDVYTTTEIEVMLEVIAEKFSNVVTYGAGGRNVSYEHDSTYYLSKEEVMISRVAAKINHKSGQKKLTMLQGIQYYDHNPRMATELRLAIECAEKANRIFPGTVEGFLFKSVYTPKDFKHAEETLKLIRELKNSSVGHLKIGTWMRSDVFKSYKQNHFGQNENDILTATLRESNFIIYDGDAIDQVRLKGVEVAFELVGKHLLKAREQLRQNYAEDELEIIARITWRGQANNKLKNVKNLKEYWELADQWARRNSFPIRYFVAFDKPTLDEKFANTGWWKLVNNSKSDQRSGYIEKISELKELLTTPITVNSTKSVSTSSSETQMSNMYIVGIALGSLALFILFIFVVILYLRVNTLQQTLSKQDIKDFKKGISEKAVTHLDAYNINTSALAIPYEKSFELRKDQLKIHHDKILGMGEFGCVFKAQIESLLTGSKDVALKMAKDGCTRSALKGILSEIKLLIYIGQHPNIVRLMGAYTAELEKGIVYIATELCGLGSLQSYLRNHQKLAQTVERSRSTAVESDSGNPASVSDSCERIGLHQLLQWSLEIASGMEYLGTKNIVHADLATRNVLLSAEKTAKIADFGLSRRMYNYTNYVRTQQEPLPWRWMAIESLKMCEFSTKSDVWCYGVTLWEIFSLGDQPYSGLTWTTDFVNMLVDGLRLESPKYVDPRLYQLMLKCWNIDVDNRPNFTYIKRLIENYTDTGNKTSYAVVQSEFEDCYEETIV